MLITGVQYCGQHCQHHSKLRVCSVTCVLTWKALSSLYMDRLWRTWSRGKVNGENCSKESQFTPWSLSETMVYLGKECWGHVQEFPEGNVTSFLLCHYWESFYPSQCLSWRPPAHMERRSNWAPEEGQVLSKITSQSTVTLGWTAEMAPSCISFHVARTHGDNGER